MKNIAIVAVLVLLVSFGAAYGAEAEQPKQEMAPREFVSKAVPKEVQELLDTLGFAFPGEIKMYHSGKVPGVNDYALASFDTGHGVVRTLFSLALEKDQKGNINPGGVVSEPVAYIFVDKKISWYQSEDVKAVFEKATK